LIISLKKTILLLVLVAAFAFAGELDVWWFRGTDDWVAQTGATARCRKFGTGDAISVDTTMPINTIGIENYAEVGQWITYGLTGGDVMTHYVRRPGTFAGKAFVLNWASNGIVSVDFDGFADLTKTDAADITMEYAFDDGTWDDPSDISDWTTASGLNVLTPIEDDALTMHFWQKITVGNMGKPGEYEDAGGATITLTLDEQATWIDAAGNYGTLP